jgi:hypothetical protein
MGKERSRDEIVRNAVFGWRYLARTKIDAEGLKRLVDHESARNAWGKLELKVDSDTFERLVRNIARAAIGAHLRYSDKKTSLEIQEAAHDAADLAERLIQLIERNGTLQGLWREDILGPLECAALDRLDGALTAVRSGDQNNSGRWFSQEIEGELDKAQERIHPECKNLTTSDAWKIVCVDSRYRQRQFFVSHLRNFAVFARRTGEYQPVVPRPKSKNTDLHAFGLTICRLLNDGCGSPNLDIAASLVAAVFNVTVDTETVKKWWLRRGDIT